ncbi:hypothetical protein [Pseudogemmobacter bohemicus]|uniref:hypothetical protein n=1 Tax=Pseudogemmobacter bohemicus TaxID=2250708 RepID=UPI00130035FA|nr:hypothetical protein [Pseudogemmobacter bohemicus]
MARHFSPWHICSLTAACFQAARQRAVVAAFDNPRFSGNQPELSGIQLPGIHKRGRCGALPPPAIPCRLIKKGSLWEQRPEQWPGNFSPKHEFVTFTLS